MRSPAAGADNRQPMTPYSMPRLTGVIALCFFLLASSGCQAADTAENQAASDQAVQAAGGADEHAGDDHASHEAHEGEGQALLPIMQRLGSEMVTLTHALMTDDDSTVAASAEAIAAHAPISSEELARIRDELGAELAAFEAVDESVHVASVRLRDAARSGDRQEVVRQLGEVQRGCVSCHAQFRERLRTNR